MHFHSVGFSQLKLPCCFGGTVALWSCPFEVSPQGKEIKARSWNSTSLNPVIKSKDAPV